MFYCNPWTRRYAYACASRYDHPYPPARYESRRARHSGFGVRRPLRYLSYHLDLDESQRRKVAASVERIKLAREQGELDRKKSDAAVADLLSGDQVSVDELRQAMAPRTETASTLQTTLAKELYEIANVLDTEQREEFAHLLRSGVVKL